MIQQSIGQRLRSAREAIRASLYQASTDTKIRADFLESLENDDFNFVSGALYVRGMLRSYARWLGLEEAAIMSQYDASYGAQPEVAVTAMISKPVQINPRQRRPHWLLAGAGAASILLILSLIGLINPSGNVATPPPNPVESQTQANAGSAPSQAPSTAVAEAPATPIEGLNLTVNVIGAKAWMSVQVDGADGKPYFEGTLDQGASQTIAAKDHIKIRIGDLGAVKLNLNGKDLGTPGLPGKVGTQEFTLDSVKLATG